MCVGEGMWAGYVGMAGKKQYLIPMSHALHFPTHLRSTLLVAADKLSSDSDGCGRLSATHWVVLGMG